jgi:S-layer protein (TIGR01567 family)
VSNISKNDELKDYYQILSVDRNASQAEIKHKYNFKVKIHHPDWLKGAGAPDRIILMAEEELKNINEAYEKLGDPIQRNQYNTKYDLKKKEKEQYEKYINDLQQQHQQSIIELKLSNLKKNRIFKALMVAFVIAFIFAGINYVENDKLNNLLSSKIFESNQYKNSLYLKTEEAALLDGKLRSMAGKVTSLEDQLKSREGDVNRLREEIESKTDEIRGTIATDNFVWTPQTFAGFYYDIDDNTGNEILSTNITDGKLLDTDGITYSSQIQKKKFHFKDWGSFNVIGFLGEKHFAGYVNDESVGDANEILLKKSTNENYLSYKQLEAVLKDDDTEMSVTSGTPLMMSEGYKLTIKSIDTDNSKVYLELTKEGSVVDSKIIYPSKGNATMADKTYYFTKTLGDQKKLVIIAVHFKNAFRGADQNLATVDGIWQISDTSTEVKADTQYDKMTIRTVDANSGTISMDNKDNTITLGKNKHITLMKNISIRTANDNELRYYICKDE